MKSRHCSRTKPCLICFKEGLYVGWGWEWKECGTMSFWPVAAIWTMPGSTYLNLWLVRNILLCSFRCLDIYSTKASSFYSILVEWTGHTLSKSTAVHVPLVKGHCSAAVMWWELQNVQEAADLQLKALKPVILLIPQVKLLGLPCACGQQRQTIKICISVWWKAFGSCIGYRFHGTI